MSRKPQPEQPVGGMAEVVRTLPTQDGQLMSQCDELQLQLQFQRSAAVHPKREQGTDSGQKCNHARDGMAVVQETLRLLDVSEF